MLKATALIGSLLLGVSGAALAADAPQQLAQAQMQDRGQINQEYQNRLRAAKTPEERARIQAEYDRHMQQGAVPGVETAPGTAGSGTMPSSPGRRDTTPRAGESPTGGGAVPPGQGGGGGGGDDSGSQ